jgi:hypothetical protein
MPDALYGRAADNWRPLLAIADLAGGDWPVRVRIIAEKLGGRHEDLAPVMVLEDLAAIFVEKGVELLKSEEATEALGKMEHRPWPEWKNQKPITTRQLAKLLEPFGIAPKQHRLGSANRRGYHVNQFQDVFERWLGGDNPLCRYNPSECAIFSDAMPLQPDTPVADSKAKKPQKTNACSGVADKKPQKPVLGGGDPFAELMDPRFKLKPKEDIESVEDGFPELPKFLDRRTARG